MSRSEQYSWLSLLGLGAVFFWFQMRLLDGWSVADQSASSLLGVYIVTLALATGVDIAISAFLAAQHKGRAIERDERDRAIEARANLNERIFLIAAVNVLIWQALMEGVFAGHALPKIDLASASGSPSRGWQISSGRRARRSSLLRRANTRPRSNSPSASRALSKRRSRKSGGSTLSVNSAGASRV